MPRVVITTSGDVRLRRGHFKHFHASPDALVVSEREAEMIVAGGLGKVVERDDKAIAPPPRVRAPRRPRAPAAEPVKTESEGDAG